MAERVRKYRLGEVIPEDDVDAAEAAIRKLSADPAAWRRPNAPLPGRFA